MLNNIYMFIKRYLTIILVIIVYIFNIYMLSVSINYKDKDKLTLEEYHNASLYSIFFPILFISFTVISCIIYLIYRLYTESENMKVAEILFTISLTIGFFNTAKSIAIIHNNYYKAKMSVDGNIVSLDTTSRINLIYKSLITNSNYSNIEILLLWIVPILYTLLIIILNVLVTYFLQEYNCTNKTGLDITLKDIVDYIINTDIFKTCKLYKKLE